MNDAGTHGISDHQVGITAQQRVDQSVAIVSGGRMHDKAGRLVEDDDVRVFVQNVQREVERGERRDRRIWQRHDDSLATVGRARRLADGPAVGADTAFHDRPSGASARHSGNGLGEERVEAASIGVRRDGQLDLARDAVTAMSADLVTLVTAS